MGLAILLILGLCILGHKKELSNAVLCLAILLISLLWSFFVILCLICILGSYVVVMWFSLVMLVV